MANTMDPKNENLHRVLLSSLESYKQGVVPAVVAVCGKVWSPTFPVNRERLVPTCPVCFPIEENRYGIAR